MALIDNVSHAAGEYPMPTVRTANLHAPIVSGYTTGRLRGGVVAAASASGYTPNSTTVLLENTGKTSFTVQMQETSDYTSGPFLSIGPAVALVPSGQQTLFITPVNPYLEFRGTSGNGFLKAQLTSQIKWSEMAFDKSDPRYPRQLTQKGRDPSPPPPGL